MADVIICELVMFYEWNNNCENNEHRARRIWGGDIGRCYTFTRSMPGTDCAAYDFWYKITERPGDGYWYPEGGRACDGGTFYPHSMATNTNGQCAWFRGDDCTGEAARNGGGLCTGPLSGNFHSFICVS